MNWKRAALFGLLLWVLIFFEVSILMFGFGLSQGMAAYYYAHYIILVILVIISAFLYFKGKNIPKSFNEGLAVGIMFIAVGIILDSLITVPLFVKNYAFLYSLEMIGSAVLVIVVTALIGLALAKPRKR